MKPIMLTCRQGRSRLWPLALEWVAAAPAQQSCQGAQGAQFLNHSHAYHARGHSRSLDPYSPVVLDAHRGQQHTSMVGFPHSGPTNKVCQQGTDGATGACNAQRLVKQC